MPLVSPQGSENPHFQWAQHEDVQPGHLMEPSIVAWRVATEDTNHGEASIRELRM